MRVASFTLAAAFLGTAWATNFQSHFNWAERANELGISSAHLVLNYSLTDRCELTAVRVEETSNPELFTEEEIAEITQRLIGPFDTVKHEFVLKFPQDDFKAKTIERVASTHRRINWRTEFGHRFIVCFLDSNAKLIRAEFIDGHMPPGKVVEDMPVNERLSELGTRRQTIKFSVEE